MIDVQFGGEPAVALAERLGERGTPYLFCADAAPKDRLPKAFWDALYISRQSAKSGLKTLLDDMVANRRR